MNDTDQTFERQQALLDETTSTFEVIATLRLNQPVRFLGMCGNAIDLNWMDIHPDRKSVWLRQAIESILSHVLGIDPTAVVTLQRVVFDKEGMGYPSLSICIPSQENNTKRTSIASAAIALLSQASFSDVRISGDFTDAVSPEEIDHCQAVATQVSEKYLSGYRNMPLSTTIDIELARGIVSCGGRILGSTPEIISATGDRQIFGNIVEWNTRNRCFSVKDGQEKAEWVFYDLGSDPWRALRDLLGEPGRVKVTAKQTLRKLRGGNEEAILSFDSFSVIQEELFPGPE